MQEPEPRESFSRLAVLGCSKRNGRLAPQALHTHWPDHGNPQQVYSAREHTCWSSHVPERASW